MADLFDPIDDEEPESSRRLAPAPWSFPRPEPFERHMAEPAP